MSTSNSKNSKPVITDGTVNSILLGFTHNGSQRSFALNLKGEFVKAGLKPDVANNVAWEISREIKGQNLDYTVENAKKAIPNHVSFQLFEQVNEEKDKVKKSPAKKSGVVKVEAAPKNALSEKHLAIAKDESIAKNERIRLLLVDGASQTGIANAMGIEFQRVKNVKKPIDNDNAFEMGKNAKSLAENPYAATDDRSISENNPTGIKQLRLYNHFVEGFNSKK